MMPNFALGIRALKHRTSNILGTMTSAANVFRVAIKLLSVDGVPDFFFVSLLFFNGLRPMRRTRCKMMVRHDLE
jgi:hypothetical protein